MKALPFVESSGNVFVSARGATSHKVSPFHSALVLFVPVRHTTRQPWQGCATPYVAHRAKYGSLLQCSLALPVLTQHTNVKRNTLFSEGC